MHRLLAQLDHPDVEVCVTEWPNQATDWARERADDPNQVVVAVGGDGTVHEVARGLIGGQAHLGIVPIGSGNDFASMLAHPLAPKEITADDLRAFFIDTPARCVDVGQVKFTFKNGHNETRFFINSMGLGLEGAIAGTVKQLRMIKGLTRYLLATAWQLIRYQPIAMQLGPTGQFEPEHRASPKLLVSIGNGRRAGGGFLLQPNGKYHRWFARCLLCRCIATVATVSDFSKCVARPAWPVCRDQHGQGFKDDRGLSLGHACAFGW